MTWLLVVLAVTWSGLATWTYFERRACRCERELPARTDQRGGAGTPAK